MAINKAQGQTFAKVNLCHGQLYVAFSRARAISGEGEIVRDKSTGNQRWEYCDTKHYIIKM